MRDERGKDISLRNHANRQISYLADCAERDEPDGASCGTGKLHVAPHGNAQVWGRGEGEGRHEGGAVGDETKRSIDSLHCEPLIDCDVAVTRHDRCGFYNVCRGREGVGKGKGEWEVPKGLKT
jgi:hypothetical protein